MDINAITDKVIGAAIRVHRQLGPGMLESIYEKCLAIELAKTGLRFECQAPVHLVYDGIKVGHAFYIDILVEKCVVVEIKAVDRFDPVFTAQLISYLRLSKCTIGLLLNFNNFKMADGVKRIVLGYAGETPRAPRSPRQ